MTAIANAPIIPAINRPFWGSNGNSHQPVGASQQADDFGRVFINTRGKQLDRSNSVSSISSNSSASSVSTILSAPQSNGSSISSNGDSVNLTNINTWNATTPRKRPQSKATTWIGPQKSSEPQPVHQPLALMKTSSIHSAPAMTPSQAAGGLSRSGTPIASDAHNSSIVLCLLSLNSTFDRKQITVPYYPSTLRIGRQTNHKTVPTQTNGYFDSKVLSRQHAEIWADWETAKVYIRDVKSSNGTFVNGNRLSQENRESDPYELNVGDQIELGIDIVNEDQKTVVHHKVAAKVEHVGFLPNSGPEACFSEGDPSAGPDTQNQIQGRGKAGSTASLVQSARIAPTVGLGGVQPNGMGPSRPILMAQITTDQIVKRIHQEMRNSRLQNQDLIRTGHFVGALLSKEDIRELERPETHELPRPHSNGNGLFCFQGNSKIRFSDPPAPPPQQPLPKKPDVPALKRGMTEKSKGQKEAQSQIAQLTEDLKNAKKELDSQNARMRDLEDMLKKERVAREVAEELARRLEAAAKATETKTTRKDLDDAFNPPAETSCKDKPDAATSLQTQLDAMMAEMLGLKQQLEEHKQRTEKAEKERDVGRQTLSEMVIQIREEQAARKLAEEEAQSLKRRPSKPANGSAKIPAPDEPTTSVEGQGGVGSPSSPQSLSGSSAANTTKASGQLATRHAVAQSLPYASMISVVVLGMGLMAYLNGWQPETRLQR